MSSLPPISPRLTPAAPQTSNAAAVRDARALFFKALGEVPATPPPSPAVPSAAPRPTTPTPAAAQAGAPASGAEGPSRLRPPGSIVNILV